MPKNQLFILGHKRLQKAILEMKHKKWPKIDSITVDV